MPMSGPKRSFVSFSPKAPVHQESRRGPRRNSSDPTNGPVALGFVTSSRPGHDAASSSNRPWPGLANCWTRTPSLQQVETP